MSTGILLASKADGVLRLTLNRPEKRNALNAELVDALTTAVGSAASDDAVRVVVIAGAGTDFCAGADLADLRHLSDRSVAANLADADRLAKLFLAIRQLPIPVVAAVRGRALAGGAGLATACDLVVAEETAQFGYPEVHIGFVPAMVMAILRRNVSEKKAFELVTLGERIDAVEAARIGLINRTFPAADFDHASGAFVAELAARSAEAVRLCKRLLYHQDGMTMEAAIRAGADMNVIARSTDDARAGLDRFLSKQTEGGREGGD